jgi:hypothetical protein
VKGSEKGVKRSERTNALGSAFVLSLLFFFFFQFSFFNSAKAQRVEIQEPMEVKNVVVPEEHSATKALLWSLIPGGGQIYNGQAWKVPIIYGAFAGVGYGVHYYYTRMVKFKDEYLYRVNHNDTPNLADYANYPTSNIYNLYNTYNRNFQLMVIITVGVYALNLVDAYVFGHLYDFRIDDDITLAIAPTLQSSPLGFQPSLGLTLSF